MSLIGPRPDPLDDMEIYTEHQKKKLIGTFAFEIAAIISSVVFLSILTPLL